MDGFIHYKVMRKTLNIFLLVLVVLTGYVNAQELGKVSYKSAHNVGLSVGASSGQWATALDWSHLHGIGKKNQRFKIGYGIRYTGYVGSDLNYTTAPALLTSKQEGPQVLFSETFEENIDTLSLGSAQVNALNVVIHLNYSIMPKLDIGFNIDAVGFSFGASQRGTFRSSAQQSNSPMQPKANPTPYNLLLVSDNDIGSLNSEIFLRYWLHKKWALKAGAMFLFTEYKTENKLTFDNDRFRNKTLLLMLGVSFKPFNQ
jgi:hypothetical protein